MFLPYTISKAKALKLNYVAKVSTNGKAIALLKVFDANNKSIQSVTSSNNAITSDQWKHQSLLVEDVTNVHEILIGLFAEGSDGSFKDVTLQVQNENGVWENISLPNFDDNLWFAEPKDDYLVRENNSITLKTIIPAKQLHNTVIDSLIKPHAYLKLHNAFAIIPTIVYANEKGTLPETNPTNLQHFINEMEASNSGSFTKETSLTNAIILWNAFRHFYVYQEDLNIKWDALLHQLLKDAYHAHTIENHILVLEKFLTHFKDGHIRINHNTLIPSYENTYCTPINFAFVNNTLVVKDTKDTFKGNIKKGTIITEINNTPTHVFVDSVSQYVSGSEQFKRVKVLRRINEGKLNSTLKIKTNDDIEIQLLRNTSYKENEDFYKSNLHEKHKEVTKDIYYINLSKIDDQEIDALIPTINQYRGLIIDNRNYPKDTRHRLFSYFTVNDTAKWLGNTVVLNPDYKGVKQTFNSYALNKKKANIMLTTKNVMLINENTISNGELLAQLFKHYHLATIIGKPSAGTNGNINDLKLLHNFSIIFTGLKVQNPNETVFHAVGVYPDIEVYETVNDIKNNKDVYLQDGIEFLNNTLNK
ncbi:S41 family peptidase [Flavobacterium sp. xlx-214]|uniref:S41 family peptidase n=1 Tax=Flavobacterium sp. xlx-214 TaxID=2654325 RepID=UPI0013D232DD|nr:S41 family peptidase [Flavobacterium sp. xlx-214]